MDNAVALVRSYLHVNGYFTVTEYPVIEALRSGKYRSVTDLDVLAFRFPGAGRLITGEGGTGGRIEGFAPDPELGAPADRPDMIVGEVKEGRAELNQAVTEPEVLRAALVRFGCCPLNRVDQAIESLRKTGRATLPAGQNVRLVAFGATHGEEDAHYLTITLGHVTAFLRAYLRDHWDVLHHAQFKDPAISFLMTLEKADRRAEADSTER
jgi:hypothetical protein